MKSSFIIELSLEEREALRNYLEEAEVTEERQKRFVDFGYITTVVEELQESLAS